MNALWEELLKEEARQIHDDKKKEKYEKFTQEKNERKQAHAIQ